MRLFAGLAIPEPVRGNLRSLLNQLRPLAEFRWSPVENLHVTTKFVGEFPEERIEELKDELSRLAPVALDVSIRGLGWFPNAHRPRVFWAGVEGGDALRELAAATDDATARLGIARETREYRPHLTLARMKPAPVPLDPIRRAVAALDSHDFGTFRPPGFVLYISSQGKYTSLAEFPLLTRP